VPRPAFAVPANSACNRLAKAYLEIANDLQSLFEIAVVPEITDRAGWTT
jgi:hypothetical protein